MTIGRPFQPGQSGNPNGRPKSRPFKEAIDRAIKIASAETDGKDILDQIALALVTKAMTGDVPALKEFADRLDGKVPQAIIGDDGEDPIRLEAIERRIVHPDNTDS